MNTLQSAWTLAWKDVRSFVRDRTALVLSILVPIALVTVFGWIMAYAFGGSGSMPAVKLHVADLSNSATSEQFIERLQGLDMVTVRLIEQPPSETGEAGDDGTNEEATLAKSEKLIRDGDAHHVLVIPADYDQSVQANEMPKLRMLRDPGRQMEDRLIQLSIMQASMSEMGDTLWVDAMDRVLADQGMGTNDLAQVRSLMTQIGDTIEQFAATDSGSEQTPAPVEGGAEPQPGSPTAPSNRPNANRPTEGEPTAKQSDSETASTEGSPPQDNGFDPMAMFDFMQEMVPVETSDIEPPDRPVRVTYQQAQSVAGMSVMMLLFALTSCGSVLLTEREEGTLRRLFAQPIPRVSILLGKFLFVLMVGIGQMSILFVYGEWMFGVGLFRDPVTLVVLSLSWVACGGAFGMFLASVSRSNKQAESLASLLILMMAALGGCWFPIQMMTLPPLLETVCKSTMTYWAMTGFQGMLWNQLPWYESKILIALAWQWGWAIALTGLSFFFYQRNYCRG